MSRPEPGCPFCAIVAGRAPARFVVPPTRWPDALAFLPLRPVTPGHVLIVSRRHVPDFAADPEVYAAVSRRAAELACELGRPDANVITSRGTAATQSVFHLHVHLVPRVVDDGLALPWYSGRGGRAGRPTTS